MIINKRQHCILLSEFIVHPNYGRTTRIFDIGNDLRIYIEFSHPFNTIYDETVNFVNPKRTRSYWYMKNDPI